MSWLLLRQKVLAGMSLATLLTLGCEPPPVVPIQDGRQQVQAARIEGNVVVQGPARGNAVVFLYDAERPPPPQGTGRPVAFTLIPQAELFGSALEDPSSVGPFTAPFIFDIVAPGRYLLRGFIDTDTCRAGAQSCHGPDFIPWYNVTGEPNVGDVAGAAVDPVTRAPRVVEVGVSETGMPLPVLGVSVSFSDQATVKADRPVFEVVGPTRIEATSGVQMLRLRTRPIREGVVDLRAPVFLVHYRDEDRNGAPDDFDADGAWDLWPRVVVRKLADTGVGLTDENDLDGNGVLDAEGVDYLPLNGTQDGEPDLVVLGARLLPNAFADQLTDETGNPRMNTVLQVSELLVGLQPIAFDARNPRAPVPLKTLPSGRYAVIVLQSSGQVWRVPNELSPVLAPGLGLPSLDSQAYSLEVP